jgi:hypothetical protein
MPNPRRLYGFVVAVALLPVSAFGQTTHSLDAPQQVLREDQTVVVTDAGGHKVKGKVERISTAFITVAGQTVADAAITEIRLQDSLWNGMLVGAAVGTGLATWDYLIDPSEPGNAAIFTVAVGLGAAIGAGIDASRKGQMVYTRPRPLAVRMLPFVERHRQGVLVSVRF